MKLLMVSGDRAVLEGKRGAFFSTLQELRKHFERIDILCPHSAVHASSLQLFVKDDGGEVWFHPNPRGLWSQPWWILSRGKSLVADVRPDVMTVHEYPPFMNGLGAWLLHRATRIPYAIEIHHIVGFPVAARISEWVGRFLSRGILRFDCQPAGAVRAVTASAADHLSTFGVPREKIRVIPSFYLDHAALHPDPTIAKEFDLVVCGRLVPNKGLEALLLMLPSLPAVRLLVLGDGPIRPTLERLVQSRGLSGRVVFRGWVAQSEDLYRLMQSAKVFVMNSRSEGGPRVALEAMACGMPVISTKVGAMPEVIESGRNGILVGMDSRELSSAISHLLSDEALRQRMGAQAQKILDRFERTTGIAAYADFLSSLAS